MRKSANSLIISFTAISLSSLYSLKKNSTIAKCSRRLTTFFSTNRPIKYYNSFQKCIHLPSSKGFTKIGTSNFIINPSTSSPQSISIAINITFTPLTTTSRKRYSTTTNSPSLAPLSILPTSTPSVTSCRNFTSKRQFGRESRRSYGIQHLLAILTMCGKQLKDKGSQQPRYFVKCIPFGKICKKKKTDKSKSLRRIRMKMKKSFSCKDNRFGSINRYQKRSSLELKAIQKDKIRKRKKWTS